jgi:hypothetical protein
MRFELTGEPARQRDASCKTCGSLRWCDECWDHVRGYSPFVIWHCLLCRMPTFFYEHTDADVMAPKRCDYCGWDEATECILI